MASDARIHVCLCTYSTTVLSGFTLDWWATGKIMGHDIESREAHIRLAKSKVVKVMKNLSTSLPMSVTMFKTVLG